MTLLSIMSVNLKVTDFNSIQKVIHLQKPVSIL